MRRKCEVLEITSGLQANKPVRHVYFTLKAPNGKKLKGEIKIEESMLSIGFQGYGEHGALKGHGTPVLIEYREFNGELALLVRAFENINSDEATATISLAGAAEKKRR